jgi:WD40 repeat protein
VSLRAGVRSLSSPRVWGALLVGIALSWGFYLTPLKPRVIVPPEPNSIPRLTFSPTSEHLVTVHQRLIDRVSSSLVRLWRASDGRLTASLIDTEQYVDAVAFSPDGAKVACREASGRVTVWRCPDGQLLEEWTVRKTEGMPRQLIYAQDGRLLAQDPREQTIFLDVAAAELAFDASPLLKHAKVFTHTRPGCLAAQTEDEILVVRTGTSELAARFPLVAFRVFDFSSDYRTFIGVSAGEIVLARAEHGRVRSFVVDFTHGMSGAHFLAPDGRHAVVIEHRKERKWLGFVEDEGSVSHGVLYPEHGPPLATFAPVDSGAFAPDGKTLALVMANNSAITLWDFPLGKPWGKIIGAGLGGAAIVLLLLRWHANHRAPRGGANHPTHAPSAGV